MKEFFGGLALNRSMQGITIYLDLRFGGDDSDEDEISDKIDEDEKDEINSFIKQIFEALLPLFQFNNNLQFFHLVVFGWTSRGLTSGVNDMILACQSLKSIRLHCKMDWKIERLLSFVA